MTAGIIDLWMALVIFGVTLVSGAIPFVIRLNSADQYDFAKSEALASGVFLGAGLVHLLFNAVRGFLSLGFHYPWPFVICGTTFLILMLPDYLYSFSKEQNKHQLNFLAITSNILLSVHSFFCGAALGITNTLSLSMVIFFAILAHKWVSSFSLAIYLNESSLRFASQIRLFLIYSFMVPLGIYFGYHLQNQYPHHISTQPVFSAIAAGTFIYLGSIHGFKKIMIKKTRTNFYQYLYLIFGFSLMSLVAIWV